METFGLYYSSLLFNASYTLSHFFSSNKLFIALILLMAIHGHINIL